MPTYRIEHQHPERRTGALGWVANIENCATAMGAVEWAARCYTWARGHADTECGVIWPFNPDMLVDGVPAYRVAAAEYGGMWLAVALQRDALTERAAA